MSKVNEQTPNCSFSQRKASTESSEENDGEESKAEQKQFIAIESGAKSARNRSNLTGGKLKNAKEEVLKGEAQRFALNARLGEGAEKQEKGDLKTKEASWLEMRSVVRRQASKKAAVAAQRQECNPETENYRVSPEADTPASRPIHSGVSPETETPKTQYSYERYSAYIGETPLVELTHMVETMNPHVRVFAKCEMFNPGFSIKDRIVQNIFSRAIADGRLQRHMTVVAASSGNTGASTAMMCAMHGYKCIITTSPKCSIEKMDAIRSYGAELIVSPDGAKEGEPDHYMEIARLLALKDPENYFDVNQYDSQENPEGHYLTLGPEIWESTRGAITHFVAAGSTGGTISGTGRFLKEQNNAVRVVLADPVGSIFTNYFATGELGKPGKFLVEGVGKGSIPGAMDFRLIDDVISVTDQEAFDMCHRLAREEGICAGGSSGLNIHAALKLAAQLTEPSIIVTVMPDLGVKYLSKVYNSEWLIENNLRPPPEVNLVGVETLDENGEGTFVKYRSDSADCNPEETYTMVKAASTPETSFGDHENDTTISPHPTIDSYKYEDLVGDTPLVDLSHLVRNSQANVRLLAKCEMFNPGYSIKDRIVRNILDKAESDGRLRKGMIVVAASSGNTGASTAMMCAMRGYKCIITTSPKCSKEKMDAIRAYGAQLLVSPDGAKEGEPTHYMEIAKNLALEDPELYFDVDQYDTKSNPEGHYLTLGPEIWEQTTGTVSHFVAAGSTGGTVSGTGRFLKEQNSDIKVVLGDPVGSIFTEYFQKGSYTKPGPFLVEGVGKGSIPGAMDFGCIDAVIPVSDQEAFDTCFLLCRKEGICAGGSSGLNLFAALKLASTLEQDATIVTVFPDLGVKYLSKIYNDSWLEEHNLLPPTGREELFR